MSPTDQELERLITGQVLAGGALMSDAKIRQALQKLVGPSVPLPAGTVHRCLEGLTKRGVLEGGRKETVTRLKGPVPLYYRLAKKQQQDVSGPAGAPESSRGPAAP